MVSGNKNVLSGYLNFILVALSGNRISNRMWTMTENIILLISLDHEQNLM